MNLAMTYFGQDDELQNLCTYASATYRAHAQNTHSPPAAEEVFPDLCHHVAHRGPTDPMEYSRGSPGYADAQVAKLCAYIRYVFQTAPHLIHSLVQVAPSALWESPISEVPRETTTPVATSSNTEIVQLPKNVSKAVQLEDTDNTVALLVDESASKKISPYRVEQSLTQKEVIRIVGEALFVYSDGYYAHISAECLRRLIMKDCRRAVEATGTPRLIDEVFKFLLCDPDLYHQEDEIDENLICFDNGVLDIRSGNLYPHSPVYNIFYRVNTWWGDHSSHPYFDRFMHDITAGDDLLKQRILECIGYCLSSDTHDRFFFVFQGVGGSGKSVLAKFIRACINSDAATALNITKLSDRFEVANLVGKQLCLSMDLPSTPLKPDTTATFKSVTGGDPITADVKYCPHITFFNRAKFILGTNHALLTQDDDPAFFDRVVAIPFKYGIPHDRRNPHLLDALASERASIVYDALQAYRALRDRNYQFSGHYPINEMFMSSKAMQAPSIESLVQEFVQNFCSVAPGELTFVDDLFACFCEHYPSTGVNEYRFGNNVLAACYALGFNEVSRGPKKRKEGKANAQANLIGLKLKEVM